MSFEGVIMALARLVILFLFVLIAGCTQQINNGDNSPSTQVVYERQTITPAQTEQPTEMDLRASLDKLEIEPYPEYLRGVFPAPASIYSLSEENYFKELNIYAYGVSSPSVCVLAINSAHLLEPGDALDAEAFLDRMYISLDGVSILTPIKVTAPDVIGADVYGDDGKFLFKLPDGEIFTICWPADIRKPGIHIATFVFKHTSGKLEQFTWPFGIE